MEKKTMAVLFGGQSSEHEVSCMSAANVIDCIDTDKYELILIGITKEGHWIKADSVEHIRSGEWRKSSTAALISPDAVEKCVYLFENGSVQRKVLDVVFPVLHGLYGEDGTVQGLLELAQIPYVGCGVLASAVSMDKIYTKIIVNTLGIRQADYVWVHRRELADMEAALDKVENALPYPVFVKPSCAGSSVGVSKAKDRDALRCALITAAEQDSKVLIEELMIGREVECAVLGGKTAKASGVGEILAAAEFYDYDAKYNDAASKTDVDPDMSKEAEEAIRDAAVRIFHAVDGRGLARVDFFLTEEGPVFNEINTLPGFTSISMYPMLWEHRGISKKELIQRLIDTAFTRKED